MKIIRWQIANVISVIIARSSWWSRSDACNIKTISYNDKRLTRRPLVPYYRALCGNALTMPMAILDKTLLVAPIRVFCCPGFFIKACLHALT